VECQVCNTGWFFTKNMLSFGYCFEQTQIKTMNATTGLCDFLKVYNLTYFALKLNILGVLIFNSLAILPSLDRCAHFYC
jgi:hypothetical protein